MALLVAVGALMHVFAVRIGAGTVIFTECSDRILAVCLGLASASCMVVEGACWSMAESLWVGLAQVEAGLHSGKSLGNQRCGSPHPPGRWGTRWMPCHEL